MQRPLFIFSRVVDRIQRLDRFALLITLIGALLRIVYLPRESLWLDEWWYAEITQQSWVQLLEEAGGGNTYLMPVYPFLVKAVVALFGLSEWSLRLPSALLSIAAIPFFYRVSNRLLGRTAGCLAAILLAMSPFMVFYAVEAGPYAIWIACSIIAIDQLMRGRDQPEGRSGWVAGVMLTVAALSHYFALLLVGIFGLLLLHWHFTRRYQRLPWLPVVILPCTAVALWLIGIGLNPIRLSSNVHSWMVWPSLSSVGYALISFLGGWRLAHDWLPLVVAASALLIFIGLASVAKAERNGSDWSATLLSGSLLLLPFLSIAVLSWRAPAFTVRYISLSALGVYWGLAGGLTYFSRWIDQRWIVMTSIITLIAIHGSVWTPPIKVAYRAIAKSILDADAIGTVWICDYPESFAHPLIRYYLPRTVTVRPFNESSTLTASDIVVATATQRLCRTRFADSGFGRPYRVLFAGWSSRDIEHAMLRFETRVIQILHTK